MLPDKYCLSRIVRSRIILCSPHAWQNTVESEKQYLIGKIRTLQDRRRKINFSKTYFCTFVHTTYACLNAMNYNAGFSLLQIISQGTCFTLFYCRAVD